MVRHRLRQHLSVTTRSHSIFESPKRGMACLTSIFNRKVMSIVCFELLFAIVFAGTLVAVNEFYNIADRPDVRGGVVEVVGPLLATVLPTFFLLTADVVAWGILHGHKKRLVSYQPWHLFFRAVLFRFAAMAVVIKRWTECYPDVDKALKLMPLTTTTTTTTTTQLMPLKIENEPRPVMYTPYDQPENKYPEFCPQGDIPWEVMIGRQCIIFSLFTAALLIIEAILIFGFNQWRHRQQQHRLLYRQTAMITFPASHFAAYAVCLHLLALVGAYFFPLAPALNAFLLFVTFYAVRFPSFVLFFENFVEKLYLIWSLGIIFSFTTFLQYSFIFME